MKKLEVRLVHQPGPDPIDGKAQGLDLDAMARASREVIQGTAEDVLPLLLRALPPTRLFETSRGERFFGAERFDRQGNRRFHVHTFGNLIHANFRIPSCDYRQLLEVTRILTKNHGDVLECYRRMAFNVLAHNRDDHAKNFAFRMTAEGGWELAPAYDLVFAPGPGGEHTMTIAGEGRAPKRSDLLKLADLAKIPGRDAQAILDEVTLAVANWRFHARKAGVGARAAKTIEKWIAECLARV